MTVIIHINGKLRQGKGVLMTKFGLFVADHGGKVITNYYIDSPNASIIDFYDLVSLLKKPRQTPAVTILIDELPTWIDSYVSSSKANRYASHFLNQSAKLGYSLIYTAQRSKRVDINYREMSDVGFKAVKDVANKKFVYFVLDPEQLDEDIPTGRRLELPFSEAEKFWDRYDTYECVAPIGLDEMLTEMEKYDSVRKNATVDRQAEKVLEYMTSELSAVDLRPIAVESALLALGESCVFSRLVGYRLGLLVRKTQMSTPQTETLTKEVESVLSTPLSEWSALRR